MTILGLDYAGGRPGGAAIKAAGYGFVVRYLTPGGPVLPGKLLTVPEYADLQAHGVAVVANFETTATRMKDGHDAGIVDASNADTVLRALGHPPDRPVYFSADWDATPADQAEIDDYLRGAASVIGADRVGVYGGYWVVKRCLDNHTARWAWQTGAWSPTESDGRKRVDPRAHIIQRIGTVTVSGVECDVNEALQPDFGQHPVSRVARRNAMIANYSISGQNHLRLVCPVGSTSAITDRAWISGVMDGPNNGAGHLDVWFQDDAGGVGDVHWDLTFSDGHSTRCWAEVPSGATQINIEHNLPGDGTVCLEILAK